MIYCRRLPTQIHFVHLCIHSLVHLPCEVVHIGPLICSSQWTLGHTIGNLGKEIKQHSSAFANLSQRSIRHTHINMLKALFPDIDNDGPTAGGLPCGSKDLGDHYVLLHA